MTDRLGNARIFERVRQDLQREVDNARKRGDEKLAERLQKHADMAAADRDREQRFEERHALKRGGYGRY